MLNKIFSRPEPFNVTKNMSPAVKARGIWDERVGNATMQAYSWRMCSFALCFILLCAIGGLVYMSNKSMYIPYVVTVDKASGNVDFAGVISPSTDYVPEEAEIAFFIRQFVENTRNIPYDPDVYEANWTKAFHFMTKDASREISEKRRIENPYNKILRSTTSVAISTVIPINQSGGNIKETNQVYQVQWEEKETDKGSGTTTIVPYTGIVTVTYIAPDKESAIHNPLGIYIADWKYEKSGEPYTQEDKKKNNNNPVAGK